MGMNGAALATSLTIVAYNILRLAFVKHFFGIQPFEKSSFRILLLGAACFTGNYFLPYMGNVFADLIIRSVLITICFMGPVLLFKIAPELNTFAIKFLRPLGLRLKFLE